MLDVKESDIQKLRQELVDTIDRAENLESLENIRISSLGKNGQITAMMKTLGSMPPEARKKAGQEFNALKDEIAGKIREREFVLKKEEMDRKLREEKIDISLPPRDRQKGHIHPISHVMDELSVIFSDMGFKLAEGPDIEDDWHNFTALNFPPGHPAREMQDTFFLPQAPEDKSEKSRKLLRTHTSPVQIRYMTNNEPPYKIVSMGRTYRSDSDATHSPMFHQMECLYVDKDVHMGHLKGCLTDFVRIFFGVDDLPVRLRPSFFPFVEPGAEVDIGCYKQGKELKLGRTKNPGDQDWMEILGCGMVHPNVLENCGVDTKLYQGFAFGVGVERIAMLKYGIPDMRLMFESDVRWLRHYGFDPLNRPGTVLGL